MDIDIKQVLQKAFPPASVPQSEINEEKAKSELKHDIKKYGTLPEFLDNEYYSQKCKEHRQKIEDGLIPLKLNPQFKKLQENQDTKTCTIVITINKEDLQTTEKSVISVKSAEKGQVSIVEDYKRFLLFEETAEKQRKYQAKMLVDEVLNNVISKGKLMSHLNFEQ